MAKGSVAAGLVVFIAACAQTPASTPPTTATGTLVVRGILHTMDAAHPRATVAVIQNGRFSCVGDADTCAMPVGARVIDLAGGSATPGLIDAHGHVASYGRSLLDVSLSGAKDEAECVARIAERAKSTPKGTWIVARRWDQTRWPGQTFPTEAALSRAVPEHPVFATRVDGHAVWVNAQALSAAGVTKETKDPNGGHIVRGADGRPTGVLVDNAEELVSSKLPAMSAAQIEQAILEASARLVALGLTSVHDAGVDAQTLEVYRALATRDRLPLRVYAMIDGQQPMADLSAQMDRWKKTPEVGRLTVRAVKLYADGALGSRGARLFEPYADDPGNRGLAVTEPDELRRRILEVARAGYQPCVHAIGDRASAETLADFVEASKLSADLRPRVEHLQILRAADAHLLKEAGAVASMQPTHATSDGPWAEARLGHGSDRQHGAYAWRQVIDLGVPLACGSDFPVEDPDPRPGLYSAETRSWPEGPPGGWMPEQRMSRLEALKCFTSGAAYSERAETRRGMIRAGFEADLTAFEGDIMQGPARPDGIPVTFTIVGGKVVYSRLN